MARKQKKKGDFYIKLITAVLFLAVACYFGVYIYNATQNTFVTTPAFSYTIEDAIPASGYIIRTEMAILDTGVTILPIVSEGEKVASGQAVAVEYTDRDAYEIAGEIHELRLRIAQLEMSGGSISEKTIYESVLELSKAVNTSDLGRLDELSLKIENYIFTGVGGREDDLPALRARLDALESRSTGMRTINAPASGLYSHQADGFENVAPNKLTDLRPSELAELFGAPSSTGNTAGKLITGLTWYYAAVIDFEESAKLEPGQRVTVQFTGVYRDSVEMLIESVGRRENGKCVVVFSSDRGLHDVTMYRQPGAEIIIEEITGIRIPKEAMRLDDDGVTYIFMQTGARAERVNVEIIYEFGDSYLVRDGAASGTTLHTGATIIVKANNLYDGKVL
ncbi:MAG: hypothetical protein FWG48_03195 [Oscillospiraceae bacterium]|nr:hypothetical protein [Oscillospiraceae bacterium]